MSPRSRMILAHWRIQLERSEVDGLSLPVLSWLSIGTRLCAGEIAAPQPPSVFDSDLVPITLTGREHGRFASKKKTR
jgi:hypothetical protein